MNTDRKINTQFSIKVMIGLAVIGLMGISACGKREAPAIDNAAVYYQKAFQLMKYPTSEEVKGRLKEVRKNGWRKKDEQLEKVLKQNEETFGEFKKGITLKKCDFNFGKKYTYLIEKIIIPNVKARDLTRLILLKGRYYEKEGDFNKAIDEYLSLLIFAQHISQEKFLVTKATSLLVAKEAYAVLRSHLNSSKINKERCAKILDYLEKHERECFPPGEFKKLIEVDKEGYIGSLQMGFDSSQFWSQMFEDRRVRDYLNAKGGKEAYKSEILRQTWELADTYYGNFIKAVETNEENDWDFARNELDSLKKEAASLKKKVASRDLGDIIEDGGINPKIFGRMTAITYVAAGPSGYKRDFRINYSALKELKELQSLAREKTK